MQNTKIIRYLFMSLASIVLLAYAIFQIFHPMTAMTETKGTVVALETKEIPERSSIQYRPEIRFFTQERKEIRFVANQVEYNVQVPETDRLQISDEVSVTYFPWSPEEAQWGTIPRSFILAVGLQWLFIGCSSLIGMFLGGWSFIRLYRIRRKSFHS